jgi:hypothetical protein
MSTVALINVAKSNNLSQLYEAGDSAGDALQARLGLANFWFFTGHHTDVGVAHPGPFALWLKAAAEVIAPFTGFSVLGMSLAIFTIIKVVFVIIGAAGVASFTKKPIAGLVFSIIVLSGGWVLLLDAVAVGLQSLPIWPFIALVPTAMALARGDYRFLPLTIFVSGAAMHIHSVSAPAGALIFFYGLWKLFQRRIQRDFNWWSSALIALIFAVPLLSRLVSEPGWPLSIRDAVNSRVDNIENNNVERLRFQLLAERLALDVDHVFIALLLAVILSFIIFIFSKVWREAMIPFIIVAGWAAGVAWLSPPDQATGTELYWISGWWASFVGVVFGIITATIFSFLPKSLKSGASIGSIIVAVVLALSTIPTVFDGKISGTVGVDGGYVPALVDAVVENADGRLVVVGIDNRWLEVEMGLVLELDRLKIPHCLLLGSIHNTKQMDLFFKSERFCGPLTGDELLVGSVREPTDKLLEVWYTQEYRIDTGAMHPYFSFGIPLCSPNNEQRLPYPSCTISTPNSTNPPTENSISSSLNTNSSDIRLSKIDR